MSEEQQDVEQTIDLSEEDLAAALDLLSTEEHSGRAEWSASIAMLVFVLLAVIIIYACPLGLLIVWFDRGLGIGLLSAGVVAFIALGALSVSGTNPVQSFTRLRRSFEESSLAEAINAGLKRREASRANLVLGCLLIPLALTGIAGIVWLIYGLATARAVSLPSLALIALPILVMFGFTYDQLRREYLYYSRVSRLRSVLESQAQEPGEISVSAEDLAFLGQVEVPSFLGQVETQQMVREIKQAAPETRTKPAESYSIAIDVRAREYLQRLPLEQSLAIRRTIDSLQFDPHPSNTEPGPGDTNLLVLRQERFAITYHIDEEMRQLTVVDIHDTKFFREVGDAS